MIFAVVWSVAMAEERMDVDDKRMERDRSLVIQLQKPHQT